MKTEEFKIEGMSCGHCVMAVKKELGKLDGIIIQNAEIGSAKVQYDESKISRDDITKAVEEAGYKIVN